MKIFERLLLLLLFQIFAHGGNITLVQKLDTHILLQVVQIDLAVGSRHQSTAAILLGLLFIDLRRPTGLIMWQSLLGSILPRLAVQNLRLKLPFINLGSSNVFEVTRQFSINLDLFLTNTKQFLLTRANQ